MCIRDSLSFQQERIFLFPSGKFHGHGIAPVSYTHLDVYKRQLLHHTQETAKELTELSEKFETNWAGEWNLTVSSLAPFISAKKGASNACVNTHRPAERKIPPWFSSAPVSYTHLFPCSAHIPPKGSGSAGQKLQSVSIAALIVSILPLAALAPSFQMCIRDSIWVVYCYCR